MNSQTAMNSLSIIPSEEVVEARFQTRCGNLGNHGWRVRMRYGFGYFESDDWYEAVVDRLVTEESRWIDVGGGKSMFPQNTALADTLSRRCALLVGVDPSDGIRHNRFVHQWACCTLEEYDTMLDFDVATLRMVAEHVENPDAVVASLSRLMKSGGRVVIYTPNRWTPASMIAAIVPYRWHPTITRFLWNTKDEDVFPTVYRMNTRKCLRDVFKKHGFRELEFEYLANCTTFQRFRWSCFLELAAWKTLKMVGVLYPENNLIGVYEKS